MNFSTNQHNNKKRGFSLVEILIGAGILGTVIVAAIFSIVQIQELESRTTSTIRANYLLLEAVDVTKILRDNGWSANVSPLLRSTPYYIAWDGVAWEATTTESTIDGSYYRYVQFEDVNRDANDNIAVAGTLDPGTLKVIATVAWLGKGGTTTKEFETYITDLYGN